MEWYYSKDNKQQGPVSPAELIALQEAETISGDALVWRDGQGDWKQFREVANEIFAAAGRGSAGTAVCAHSGKVLSKSEMVPYGDAWVAPEHKEAFVQRLMEGERLELNEAGEYALEYVGFWWRVLGSTIDYFVKLIPYMLCSVPYYIVAFSSGMNQAKMNPEDPFAMWTPALIVTSLLAMLGQLAVSIFYDTWMVGKYQATVGKMAIGAVVVNPEGGRITYWRSFGRWAAKKPLNLIIIYAAVAIPVVVIVMIGAGIGAAGGTPDSNWLIAMPLLMIGGMTILFPLAMFPYWMCGRDSEKRTLHDRVCATRVVKKKLSR